MKIDIIDIDGVPTKRYVFDRHNEKDIIRRCLLERRDKLRASKAYIDKYKIEDKYIEEDLKEVTFMIEQIEAWG